MNATAEQQWRSPMIPIERLAWTSEASNGQFGSFVGLTDESLIPWSVDPEPLHFGQAKRAEVSAAGPEASPRFRPERECRYLPFQSGRLFAKPAVVVSHLHSKIAVPSPDYS